MNPNRRASSRGPVPRPRGAASRRARFAPAISLAAVALAAVVLIAALPVPALAQTVSFGKNKVQYKNFQWRVLESEHFHLYFYPEEEELARTALEFAETAYDEVAARFRHEVSRPIPLIIYSSHQDFEQTNISPYFLPEGVAGFTEFLKGRVAMPFNGSYTEFRHTLKHEIVHVFQISRLDESLRLHYRNNAVGPPLWFTEGMADHWSGEWDGIAEVFMQDMVIHSLVPPIRNLWHLNGTFTIYKVGQHLVSWLEENFGRGFIPRVYEVMWRYDSFEQALAAAAGMSEEELNARWHYELDRRYLPRVEEAEPVTLAAKAVITEGGANFKAAVPPEGSGIDPDTFFFLSPRTGYTNIYRASVHGREEDVDEIVEGQRSAEFESFHPFQSKMDVDRHGRLVFVSKFHERDALFLYDVALDEVVGRWQFEDLVGLRSPTFNPEGTEVIFAGLSESGRQDLYRFALDGASAVRPLTGDVFQDDDLEWSPDGRSVAFVSDRTRWGGMGARNIYILDLVTEELRPFTQGPWVDRHPAYDPEGNRLAFSSDRSGTPQIHVADSTGAQVRVTSLLGMAVDPVWLRDGRELLFSVMSRQSFGIYRARVIARGDTTGAPEDVIASAPDTTAAAGDVMLASVPPPPHPAVEAAVSDADSMLGVERPFRSRFTLDFAVGGVAFEPTQDNVGQGLQALLTDQLGDRVIFLQAANTAQEFGDVLTRMSFGASYYDLSQRLNRGLSVYNFVGDYIDELGFRYFERRVGASAIVSYPYSKFFRTEGSLGFLYSDRGPDSFRPAREGFLSVNYLSLIHDNSLWLPTGPIDGSRYRLTLGLTTNLERVEVENVSGVIDLRHYFRTGLRTAYAVRLQTWISQGSFPERFVLGGSWSLRGYPRRSLIGTRAVLFNQEWRFPVLYGAALGLPFGTIGLPPVMGAVFLDAGQAWEEGNSIDDVAGSFGLGLRTSFGGLMVLRLDIARRTDFRRVFPGTEVDFFVGFDY